MNSCSYVFVPSASLTPIMAITPICTNRGRKPFPLEYRRHGPGRMNEQVVILSMPFLTARLPDLLACLVKLALLGSNAVGPCTPV